MAFCAVDWLALLLVWEVVEGIVGVWVYGRLGGLVCGFDGVEWKARRRKGILRDRKAGLSMSAGSVEVRLTDVDISSEW